MRTLLYAARPILLDMLSTITFAALLSLSGNVYLATALSMALGAGQVAARLVRRMSVPGMQWASLGLVSVLGSASLLTGDPRFVMIKPTIIYLVIAAAMMQTGWLSRYIHATGKDLVPQGMVIGWGRVWAGLMAFTAVANLVIALTMTRQTWTLFLAVFPLASKLILFALTYGSLRLAGERVHRQRLAAGTGAAAAQAA